MIIVIKYWPTVLGIFLTDQIRPFIDIHLGKQFYFGPKPIKGYPSRSDIYNFLSILLKNRKNDEASSMDFKIESPIMVISDKKWVTENTHFLFAYSGNNRMKAFNKLLHLTNDRLSLWE